MDSLVLTLLRLDEAGRVLAELLSSRSSPIDLAQKELVFILTDTMRLAELVELFFPLANQEELTATLRELVLELSGAVYYRLEIPLQHFPFRLLRIVHPECSDVEQLAAAQDLCRTPLCDLVA
jgi:hypothetical protein